MARQKDSLLLHRIKRQLSKWAQSRGLVAETGFFPFGQADLESYANGPAYIAGRTKVWILDITQEPPYGGCDAKLILSRPLNGLVERFAKIDRAARQIPLTLKYALSDLGKDDALARVSHYLDR